VSINCLKAALYRASRLQSREDIMMKKRRGQDTNDQVDLGLPQSTLRALDVAESIRDDLDRIHNDLDRVQGARESLDSIQRARERLNLNDARHNLADTRVKLADFRPGLVDNKLPRAGEMLMGQMANVRGVLGRTNPFLQGNGISEFTKPRIPPATISQAFDTARHVQGLIGGLPVAARKPAPVTPLVSSIMKASDATKGLVKPQEPRLFSIAADIEQSRPELTVPPFATLGKAWLGLVNRDMQRLNTKILNDLQGSPILKNLQGFSSLVETTSAFSPKALAEVFGTVNTIADWSVAAPNRMFDPIRRMERDLNNAYQRMMQPFDSIGRQLSGMLETFSRIDWEALERAARVQEARRPRTPIGYAALKAYDALFMGDQRVADEFLAKELGIKPTADRREALWTVLRQAFARTVPVPARWIVLEDERAAVRYLRAAVYNEAERIQRDREMEDRIWWPEGEEERDKEGVRLSKPALSPDAPLAYLLKKSPNPENLLIPPPDDRGEVLTLLYLEGSPEDKEFVRLLIIGYELAEISQAYGPQKVQRFKRKAQRWRENKLNLPTDGY
jgi:hypothetical protein